MCRLCHQWKHKTRPYSNYPPAVHVYFCLDDISLLTSVRWRTRDRKYKARPLTGPACSDWLEILFCDWLVLRRSYWLYRHALTPGTEVHYCQYWARKVELFHFIFSCYKMMFSWIYLYEISTLLWTVHHRLPKRNVHRGKYYSPNTSEK